MIVGEYCEECGGVCLPTNGREGISEMIEISEAEAEIILKAVVEHEARALSRKTIPKGWTMGELVRLSQARLELVDKLAYRRATFAERPDARVEQR